MSYDLYFCTEASEEPTAEAIHKVFSTKKHFTPYGENEDKEWVWENEATKVYFTIDRLKYEDDNGNNRSFVPHKFTDARLSFNLNYMRPSFFGKEAFPILEEICNELQLLVLDPQVAEDEDPLEPIKANADNLFENWNRHNLQIAKDAMVKREINKVYSWSHRYAMQWHTYQNSIEELYAELEKKGLDIYVPNIMLAEDNNYPGNVCRVVVWTESIPFFFPPCDMVMFLRKKKSLLGFKTIEDKGCLEETTVRSAISCLLETYNTPTGPMDVLMPDAAIAAKKIFNGFELDETEGRIEGILIEQIIDNLP